MTFRNNSVKRNFFARDDEYAFADGNFFGINFLLFAVSFNSRSVRSDIHKVGYRLTRFPDGITLEKLADLIEKNYGNAFGKIAPTFGNALDNAERKRAERCDRHQKVLVENFSVGDIPRGFR